MSWTSISGQITNSDTTRCYTHNELKKIATKIAKGVYCDTILHLTNTQLKQDSLLLINKDKEIHNYTRIVIQKDSIELGLNNKITEYKTKETKSDRKIKFLGAGWVITGVLVFLENIWIVVKGY